MVSEHDTTPPNPDRQGLSGDVGHAMDAAGSAGAAGPARIDSRDHFDQFIPARRRIMQGAFVAPAVLALHSGSVFANSSTVQCVINQADHPVSPAPLPTASPSDNYVRVQLWSLRPSLGSTDARWFVKGADVSAMVAGRTKVVNEFLSASQWMQFDPSNPATVFAKTSTTPTWTTNGNAGVLARDGKYVALRFDASFLGGHIVGVVGQGGSGSALSGSCWSSFTV